MEKSILIQAFFSFQMCKNMTYAVLFRFVNLIATFTRPLGNLTNWQFLLAVHLAISWEYIL